MRKISLTVRINFKLFKAFKLLCAIENISMVSRLSVLMEKDIKEYQEDKKINLYN